MGDLLSVIYICLFLAAGVLAAKRVLPRAGRETVIILGCAFGTAMLAVLPALLALVTGFNGICAALAAAAAAGICAACRFAPAAKAGKLPEAPQTETPLSKRETAILAACILPAVLFTFYLLYTHVLWYSAADGAYYTGQSGYGDVQMHLAFIKSIAVSGEMPPHYPLLAGQSLFGYPFLCESISSIFLVLGSGLKFAYLLPCLPALVSVFGFVWLLARRVLGSAKKACLAYVLFVLGGGFGFAYFVGSKETFSSIFTGYYTTPTNYVDENIRWVNCIADLLVPQRATLMGWSLAFACLYLLYRFAFENESRLWLPLGLLAGCLPLMQTHSLLVLVVFSGVYLIQPVCEAVKARDAKSLLPWLGYAAVAGALCLPQLFGIIFRQTGTGEHFLRFVFNWCNSETDENFLWFYIKNLGLTFVVALPAFLHAKRPLRRLVCGGLAVWALAEIVVFQPNLYDNIKLLYFWFLLLCLLAADALCDWLDALRSPAVRRVFYAYVLILGCLSGTLTLGREAVSRYQVFSAEGMQTAEYIDENAASDALFLTGMQHLNPVASLAGRDIVCGSTLYVYYHGMNYTAQMQAAKEMYENPSEELLAQWGVDYVFISSYERYDYAVDESWYAARYPVWYQNGEYVIYAIE